MILLRWPSSCTESNLLAATSCSGKRQSLQEPYHRMKSSNGIYIYTKLVIITKKGIINFSNRLISTRFTCIFMEKNGRSDTLIYQETEMAFDLHLDVIRGQIDMI